MNMDGKKEGAHKNYQVSKGYIETFRNTKEIKTQNSDDHTEPNGSCGFLLKEYPDYRNYYNVKRSDKSGFAGSGINKTYLDQYGAGPIKTAGQASGIMIFSVLWQIKYRLIGHVHWFDIALGPTTSTDHFDITRFIYRIFAILIVHRITVSGRR